LVEMLKEVYKSNAYYYGHEKISWFIVILLSIIKNNSI